MATRNQEGELGHVTAAAVRILEYGYHFLRWDGARLRTPTEVADIVDPSSFVKKIRAAPTVDALPLEISKLLRYSLNISVSNSSVKLIGINAAVTAVAGSLEYDPFKLFLSMLNWNVLNVPSKTVALKLGAVQMDNSGSGLNYYLLDGLMAAVARYPSDICA